LRTRDLDRGLLAEAGGVFVAPGIGSYGRFTWLLEVFPAILGGAALVRTYPRFRFTTLVYGLVALHAAILMVGGHYTYQRMPLFDWLKLEFHLDRNYYDRVGHFAPGFVPAIIARELLLRRTALKRGAMLSFLLLCVSMAVSAWYELLEFAVARLTGDSAEAFWARRAIRGTRSGT
jgi:putative membrane protein